MTSTLLVLLVVKRILCSWKDDIHTDGVTLFTIIVMYFGIHFDGLPTHSEFELSRQV